MKQPPTGSASFKKLNPHLFSRTEAHITAAKAYNNDEHEQDYRDAARAIRDADKMRSKPAKRIRQSSKPLMNKLEEEFLGWLKCQFPAQPIKAQAIALKIANGVTLTPDFFVFHPQNSPSAWEVKGPHAWEDSLIKLKVAASVFPEITFTLAYKIQGEWKLQKVLS